MSTTEALRVQLDNLQRENQQLQMQNARFREGQPEQAALVDEHEELQEQQGRLAAETGQLRAEYDQLVRDAQADQQALEELREELSEKTSHMEELDVCCERLKKEASEVSAEAELERYRELEKERKKWELREERMLLQLKEMQAQAERRGFQDHLSYSNCGEDDENGSWQVLEEARTRVTFGEAAAVSKYYPLIPTTNNHEVPPLSGGQYSIATTTGLSSGAGSVCTAWSGGLGAVMSTGVTRCSTGVGGSAGVSVRNSMASVTGVSVSDGMLGVTLVTRALGGGVETGVNPRAEVSPLGGAGAVAAMSTALLAHQLPLLSKFDGNVSDGDKETIEEWLEQFELVAEVCKWDGPTKLVNLVTRLRGEAYAFFKSCTPQERGSYKDLAGILKKRFTPVRIQAVQSTLFHERKQKEKESVDNYAQALRLLFHKAYPGAQRGSGEALSMGKSVLASQFASGLRQEIKAKVAGNDGDFDTLLAKARFEEAKVRDLVGSQHRAFPARRPNPSYAPVHSLEKAVSQPEHRGVLSPGGPKTTGADRCHGCGALGHYRNRCPECGRGGPAETPGTDWRGKGSRGQVANLAPESPGRQHKDGDGVSEAVGKVMATMYSISSPKISAGSVGLGPVPTAAVEIEGEPVEALLDTGSPVTIVSLEFLLQVLAKQRPLSQRPEDWRVEVERRLEPTPVTSQLWWWTVAGGETSVYNDRTTRT